MTVKKKMMIKQDLEKDSSIEVGMIKLKIILYIQ